MFEPLVWCSCVWTLLFLLWDGCAITKNTSRQLCVIACLNHLFGVVVCGYCFSSFEMDVRSQIIRRDPWALKHVWTLVWCSCVWALLFLLWDGCAITKNTSRPLCVKACLNNLFGVVVCGHCFSSIEMDVRLQRIRPDPCALKHVWTICLVQLCVGTVSFPLRWMCDHREYVQTLVR